MKKFKFMVLALLMLAMCASSAFATALPVVYEKGDYVDFSFNGPTTGNAVLTFKFQLESPWVAQQSLRLTPKMFVEGDNGLYPAMAFSGNTGDIKTLVLNLGAANPTGVYEFTMHSAAGTGLKADWSYKSGAVTPIPAAALLLGSGLAGLFGVNRFRRMGAVEE